MRTNAARTAAAGCGAAREFGYRSEPGVGGQAAGIAEGGEQVASGVGKQLRAQDRAEAVDAGDPSGVGVVFEASGELLAEVFDLPIQLQQLAGQPGDQRRCDRFRRQRNGLLPVNGLDVAALADWAARCSDYVDGDRLVHTDLHADQFLISDGRMRVIDWGGPSAGAGWVDTALLAIRLMLAGHAPAEADAWARTVPCFSAASPDHLAALTSYVAGLWTYRAASGQIPNPTDAPA
ncbi:aminoglycoside phosphotransferase (APT) family kinase protein [Saccharopolyspora phatthalungensis]|uniref:Aminoglycoside phosphotransferase (APT) family kinase protein n=1 Tax=Saccharopolyspora phatthalungensis TaxID=664693 RepID=A0A840QBC0_9PSEU|nr:aminoglycoside phosphotransferase (APT) family kinase protein [Saccharopolyspora phatthalungensis]